MLGIFVCLISVQSHMQCIYPHYSYKNQTNTHCKSQNYCQICTIYPRESICYFISNSSPHTHSMFHHDKLHTSKDIYHHNLYPHIHSYTANIHSLIYSLHSSLHNPHTHPQPISSIPTHIVNTKTMNHNSNTSKNTQSIVHSTHSILLSIAGLLIVCTKQLPLNKGSRFLLIGIGRNQVGRSSTMMENLRKIYMIYNSLYICCNTHPITDTPDCNWCID